MEVVEEKRSGNVDGGKIIPESVMNAVNRTSKNIEDVSAHFDEFLSLCDADVLAQLNPLERAQSFLLLAKVTTNIFALRLRCNGVNPDDHPVKADLERLSLYQEKVERCIEQSKALLRPSATINSQAATRFIEHSLPDLSRDQKQSLREISRREVGYTSKHFETSMHKKRKYELPEKKSVKVAAEEFLEKAARELLGENKSGVKGPLQVEEMNTDDEIDEMFGDYKGDSSKTIVIDDSD